MKSSKISGGEKREFEREKNEKLTFSKREKREVEERGRGRLFNMEPDKNSWGRKMRI